MTTPWAGDAMDTLKMKIGLLTKEGKESSAKMEAAEAVGDATARPPALPQYSSLTQDILSLSSQPVTLMKTS